MPRYSLPLLAAAVALLAAVAVTQVAGADGFDGTTASAITVTTDSDSYAVGDSIEIVATNGDTVPMSPRGGIVCDTYWPFGLERQLDDDAWESVPPPKRDSCIGIAVAIIPPGSSVNGSIVANVDPGTYRIAFQYTSTGTGPHLAYSDPFTLE